MKIQHMDHVGIIVRDLAAASAFFVDLGFDVVGEGDVEGAWVDRATGLEGAKATWVMLGPPDGGASIELISFDSPADDGPIQRHSFNTLGMRHVALAVEEIDAVVARLESSGAEAFSEIQRFDDGSRLCFVRGPEGTIIELEEQTN